MINIDLDPTALAKATDLLGTAPKQIHIASRVSIQRTITSVKNRVSVHVRKSYYIDAKTVKASLTSKMQGDRGLVISEGQPLHLSRFKIRGSRSGPMIAAVKIGHAPKKVPGLFMHPQKSLLKRLTKSAYPIKVPYGPSVPQMVGSPLVLETIKDDAERYLNQRFEHEVEFRVGRFT